MSFLCSAPSPGFPLGVGNTTSPTAELGPVRPPRQPGLPCSPASLHVVSVCAPGPPRSPPRPLLLLHLLFPPLEHGSLPVCAFVFLQGTQISTGGPLTPVAPFCGHTSGTLSLRSVPRDAICGESFFRALTCRCQSLTHVTLLSTGRL